jgi:thiamine-monophosphate kinase
MDEFKAIKAMAAAFERSPAQQNSLFESDAEIFSIGATRLAITTDEFCEEEDGFRATNIKQLGWNLVAATLSDLAATGADPAFFLHVLGLPERDFEYFASELTRGINSALKAGGCYLLGGDTSCSEHWRYVGTAIGTFRGEPLLRSTEADRLLLYATGSFGDGNLSALNPAYQAKFELHHDFMRRVRPFLGLGMDSSDGLRNTLATLCMVNPSAKITINADAVPVHPDVTAFCQSAGMPEHGFFLGSGGEYELVVGVYPDQREAFEKACQSGEATCIGSLEKSEQPGLFWQKAVKSRAKPDIPLQIDPRFHKDRQAYIEEILKVTRLLFG